MTENKLQSVDEVKTRIIETDLLISQLGTAKAELEQTKKKEKLLFESLQAALINLEEHKELNSKLEQGQNQQTTLNHELQSKNTALSDSLTKATAIIKKKEAEYAAKCREVTKLEEKIDELEDELLAKAIDTGLDGDESTTSFEQQIQQLEKQVKDQQSQIESLTANQAPPTGEPSARELELEAKAKSSAENFKKLHQCLKNADIEIETLKDSLKKAKLEIDSTETRLGAKVLEKEKERDTARSDLSRCKSSKLSLEKKVNELNKQVATMKNELDRTKAEKNPSNDELVSKLKAKIAELNERVEDTNKKNFKYHIENRRLYTELQRMQSHNETTLMQRLTELRGPLINLLECIPQPIETPFADDTDVNAPLNNNTIIPQQPDKIIPEAVNTQTTTSASHIPTSNIPSPVNTKEKPKETSLLDIIANINREKTVNTSPSASNNPVLQVNTSVVHEKPTITPIIAKAQDTNAKPSTTIPVPATAKKPVEDPLPMVEKTSNVHTEPSPITTTPVAVEALVEETTSVTESTPVVEKQTPNKQKRKSTSIEDSNANKKQKQAQEFKSPIVLLVEESFENGTTLDVCSLVRDQARFFNELSEVIDKAKASITPIRDDHVSFGVEKYKINILKLLDYSEKVFVYMINRVRIDDPELYKTTINEYLRKMQFCARENGLNSAYVRYFRLLCIVLKEANDTQLMIDTLLGVLRCRNAKYHIIPCTFNLFCIWKEVFNDPQHSFDYTIRLLSAGCFHLSTDCTKTVKNIYEKLKVKTGWPDEHPPMKSLIETMKGVLFGPELPRLRLENTVEYVKKKDDLFRGLYIGFNVINKWNYVYDTFIRVECWTYLEDFERNQYIVELFGILGRLGVSPSPFGTDKPGVKSLLEILIAVAIGKSSNEREQNLRAEARRSIMKIATGNSQYNSYIQRLEEE